MQGDSCCGRTKKPKLQGASGAKTHLRWIEKTAQTPNGQRQSVNARWTRSEPSESYNTIITNITARNFLVPSGLNAGRMLTL